MRRPRGRKLSGDEARLWGEVAKLITPLRGRAQPKTTPEDAAAVPSPRRATEPESAKAAGPVIPAAPVPKRKVKLGDLSPAAATPMRARAVVASAPSPPGLERRERRGLERGTLAIEARIDLHGLYQAEAHAALVGFVLRAHAAGHARVLVVTGKGAEGDPYSERGVLRRSVPHWLRGPDLGRLVLGFEQAARHHGGAGALYVRLRRR